MHITGLHIIVAIIILVNFFVYHVMATSTTDYDISAENFTNSNTTKSTEIGDVKKRRVKRFLSMRPGQRFLCRVNGREDALYDIPTWAHAFGFRANYDILQPLHSFPFHFITRRDIHDQVENLVDVNGISGKDCLLKMFCEAGRDDLKGGIFTKAFKVLFKKRGKYENEKLFCEYLEKRCPISLLRLHPYTDSL